MAEGQGCDGEGAVVEDDGRSGVVNLVEMDGVCHACAEVVNL